MLRLGIDRVSPDGLYLLDGGKALHAAVRKTAGKRWLEQSCQESKIRNVVGHLTEDYQSAIRCNMRSAYETRNHADAKRALHAILREPMLRLRFATERVDPTYFC